MYISYDRWSKILTPRISGSQMGGRHSGSVASANLPPGGFCVCRGVFRRPGIDDQRGSYDPSWKGVLKHTYHGKPWKTLEIHWLPSGKLTKSYWNWPSRNSGFTHWRWWFSKVFCMFTRGYHIIVIIYCHMILRYWYYMGAIYMNLPHLPRAMCENVR